MQTNDEPNPDFIFNGVTTDSLNAARIAMLRFDLTAELDAIALAKPLDRCLILASAVGNATKKDPAFESLVRESGIMARLRETASLRKSNPEAGVAPLIQVFSDKPREGVNV